MVSSKHAGHWAPVLAVSLWMVCAFAALGQQSSPNASNGSPAANAQSSPNNSQKSTASPKDSSSSNPFPMGQSEAAAKAAAQQNQREQTPTGNSSAQSNAPNAGSGNASQKKLSPAQANPFPEAQSEAAAKADENGGSQPSSAQPGSSSSGYSSSDAHLPPADLGQGTSTFHSRLDSFTRDQTQDGRVEDDLGVADFYMKNGNYRGALLRYQDALRYDPQDDAALFGVAEATCKMNRTGDAMAMFKSYATDNPQGKYALKAEKMLAHPGKCKHNF